jgi:hypothetical protein
VLDSAQGTVPAEASDFLQPQLVEAEKALQRALDKACEGDVRDADIAELIRLEESLSIASEAAKQAISVRQRLQEQRRQRGDQDDVDAPASAPQDATPLRNHRLFEDDRGLRWDAFAVYPSSATAARKALPEPYRGGWLSFNSGKEMRRLAPIPVGWKDLSDEALRELCDKAEIAPQRIRSPESRNAPDRDARP